MTKMNLIKKFFYCLRPGILITCFFCMFVIAGCKTGTDGIDGEDGKDGSSINWRGSYESPDEITNPKYLDGYYNISNGNSYIYDGQKWVLIAKAGIDGINGTNGQDGASINWRGSYEIPDEITNPKYLDVYYNITDGCSYIYDGEKWTLLAKSGKDVPAETEANSIEPLKLFLPNDNEETLKITSDSAPIKVIIPSEYQVTKVVWKKGNENSTVIPSLLLSDEDAESVILDFTNKGFFYVSENGWYDVAAKDTLGRCEWNHIEVKTIDKTPLGEVKNLAASTKDRTATVTWKDVSTTEKYNSPLKKIKVSYVYNDDETDANNGSMFVDAGIETAEILIPRAKTSDDFLRIKVQTVDEVGNISEGVKVITWCSNSVYATEANFSERLMAMTTSGEIAVVGECDISVITAAMHKLRDEKPEIFVDLDLSEVIGWTSIGQSSGNHDQTAFYQCTNLSGVILPDSLTTLDACAFGGTSITSIVIPDSVTVIGDSVFSGCKKLKTVHMPQELTYIGNQAFCNCYELKELIIPKNVVRISSHIFYNVEKSINVIFEDENSIWFKTKSKEFKGGTEIGPMVGDNINEIMEYCEHYYFYNETYIAE